MTAKYLLSCSCGQKLPVRVSQAGESVRCRCGAVLTVPALRGFASLQRLAMEEHPAFEKRRSVWTHRERTILLGAIITAIALGTYGCLYFTRPRLANADSLSPVAVWLEWQGLRQGTDRHLNSVEQDFLDRLKVNRFLRWVTLSICAAGILVMAVTYATPKQRMARSESIATFSS